MDPSPIDQLDHVIQEHVANMNLIDSLHRQDQIFGSPYRLLFQDIKFRSRDRALVLTSNPQRDFEGGRQTDLPQFDTTIGNQDGSSIAGEKTASFVPGEGTPSNFSPRRPTGLLAVSVYAL